MRVPDTVNERWSMDFVSDQLGNARRFRVLNIFHDCSREYVLNHRLLDLRAVPRYRAQSVLLATPKDDRL